jgi:aminopeptidase YwaD
MTRLRIAAGAAALAMAAGVVEAAATVPNDVHVAGAAGGGRAARALRVGHFDEDRAMRHVRRLARGIGVRVRGTEGERRGARYVARRFRSYGYKVFVQRFEVDGRTSRNVVARWPGGKRYPVVIGGHIDTVAGSPGGNDNASGVAIVLEVARLVAGKKPARNARFVAFGSEEYGLNGRHHIGSSVFVNRLGRRGRRRLAGMVSVDMVGKLLGRPLIVGTAGIGPTVVARSLYRHARAADVEVVRQTTCDCSDNGPFELAGIPAAFAWSGSEPNYHSPSDTFRSVSKRSVRRSGRAIRAFVRILDRRTLRYFRRNR